MKNIIITEVVNQLKQIATTPDAIALLQEILPENIDDGMITRTDTSFFIRPTNHEQTKEIRITTKPQEKIEIMISLRDNQNNNYFAKDLIQEQNKNIIYSYLEAFETKTGILLNLLKVTVINTNYYAINTKDITMTQYLYSKENQKDFSFFDFCQIIHNDFLDKNEKPFSFCYTKEVQIIPQKYANPILNVFENGQQIDHFQDHSWFSDTSNLNIIWNHYLKLPITLNRAILFQNILGDEMALFSFIESPLNSFSYATKVEEILKKPPILEKKR